MIAFAVMPVLAVVVAAPTGPDEACPSARQVTEAMQARFPASVISSADPNQSAAMRADVLRALLDVAADGTVVRFSLVDSRGETQLRRALPAPGRGRPVTECVALAETLAAIVERYLATITYDVPDAGGLEAPPTQPQGTTASPAAGSAVPAAGSARSAFVLVGLGWRMPTGGPGTDGEIEARLGAEVQLTKSTPRLAAVFSIGAAPTVTSDNLPEGRTATLNRFPARLGASLLLAAGPGWVEPAAAVGIDLLAVSSRAAASAPSAQSYRWSPGLEAAVGYRLKLAGHFHIRPRAAIGVALQRYEVGWGMGGDVAFSTPGAYASFGIDTGVLFQ